MNKLIATIIFALCLAGCTTQNKGSAISLEYGKILSKTEVTAANSTQATVAGYRELRKAPKSPIVDKNRAEGNIDQLTADKAQFIYTIAKTNGSTEKFRTEKGFFVERDCVSIEKTTYTNLRLVDDNVCRDLKKQQALAGAQRIKAKQCELAKRQVILAQTDREVFNANEAVITMCQFARPKR